MAAACVPALDAALQQGAGGFATADRAGLSDPGRSARCARGCVDPGQGDRRRQRARQAHASGRHRHRGLAGARAPIARPGACTRSRRSALRAEPLRAARELVAGAQSTSVQFGIFDHVDDSGLPTAAHYETRLSFTEAMDRLGFYSYHVAEHHGTPLGLHPRRMCILLPWRNARAELQFGPHGLRCGALSSDAPCRRDLHARPAESAEDSRWVSVAARVARAGTLRCGSGDGARALRGGAGHRARGAQLDDHQPHGQVPAQS